MEIVSSSPSLRGERKMQSENPTNRRPPDTKEHRNKRRRTDRTAMVVAETSHRSTNSTSVATEEMNSYITQFPESPEGTVKTWKQYEEKATMIYKMLRENFVNGEGSQAEKLHQAEELTADLKSVTNNIDMKIAWSEIDMGLQKNRLAKQAFQVEEHVIEPIQNRTNTLQTTSELLKSMSRYSNKTETKTFVTDTRDEGTTELFETGEIKEMMAGVKVPSPCKDEVVLQDTMNKDYVDPWWTNQKDIQDLEIFSNFLDDLLSKVTLLKPMKSSDSAHDKQVYKSRMEETAQLILDWKRSSIVPNKKVFFPNETSAEKQAVQPILYSVLRALATTDKECAEDSMDKRSGDDIHRERTYPPTHEQETKRQIDFEVGATRQYTPVALPMMATQSAMEAKNTARKNQHAKQMHLEVIKQVIGHCSKKVSVAFDIGNIGVDGSSTGIILTPVYMQAVQVRLEDTGSDDVKIVTNLSKMFPLVSSKTFKKLVKMEHNQDYLYQKLFPSTNELEPAVPVGLRHLRDLARASEQDLGGVFLNKPNANATFQEFRLSQTQEEFVPGPKIEKLIGSGAHGLVYSVPSPGRSPGRHCVKASRVGEISHIKQELETLRLFAADSNAPDQIPHLLSIGRLKYHIRNSAVTVPAFLFEPRGVPVATMWKNSCTKKELIKQANLIWEHISLALGYSHERKIFHLDPRLANFIWDSVKRVYILGDWSSSAVIYGNKGIKGFRGALPFASARVHVLSYNSGWMPQKQHDFASLGLSIASFLSGQSVPWSGFYKRFNNAKEDCFKQRRKIASGILTEYNMKQEIVDSFNKEDQEGHLH